MRLLDRFIILLGKSISRISKVFNLGAGATWPGEIALTLHPNIMRSSSRQFSSGIILVVGTNGKTTTSLMIKKILEQGNKSVVHNKSGANLLNGLVSACVEQAGWDGRVHADWGVFEVDENSLPIALRYIDPKAIVFLNLFRDQLDRYGEVDVIAEKWEKALKHLGSETHLILNADDPLIAFLGSKSHAFTHYFGVNDDRYKDSVMDHATDSIFCMRCGARLSYHTVYFSHIGDWYCKKCRAKRPKLELSHWKSPLPGLYNIYNTLAAVLTGRALGIKDGTIQTALTGFTPAFGRQEEFVVEDKRVKLFLSKNPASFNASLRTVLEFKPDALLLVLNDRIPDGRDVSWIWDVDFETISKDLSVVVSGDRVYDMGVRMKYARTGNTEREKVKDLFIEEDIGTALQEGLRFVKPGKTLYVLPTYSAMLDVRKVLTGRKIL